jgi:hypothetical protein
MSSFKLPWRPWVASIAVSAVAIATTVAAQAPAVQERIAALKQTLAKS